MFGSKGRTVLYVVLAVMLIVGIGCLIAGIVLIVQYSSRDEKQPETSSKWSFSEEGKRSGLEKLLEKVRDRYYALYPNKIAYKPNVSPDEVKRKYKPFNPSPNLIKERTDSSKEVLKEINEFEVTYDKLKPFEKRALAQVKYWVHHVFPYGVPYGYDYYNGDWMIGPDIFCWTPICHMPIEIQSSMIHFKPTTTADMGVLEDKMKEIRDGILANLANMHLGVAAGMVRSVEECKSGLNSFKSQFRQVSLGGERGILNSSFVKPLLDAKFVSDFYKDKVQVELWETNHGQTVNKSIQDFVILYVGRPLDQTLRYLELNYSRHCVSSNISSGLSLLPLQYVYVNNVPTGPTTGRLPTGEPLDGPKTYYKLLSYFTTTAATPEEIYKMGNELLDSLYKELLELARKITGKTDEEEVKASIKAKLDVPDNYFNTQPIPDSESNDKAFSQCISMETAKVHCPVRWNAMQRWFSYVRELSTVLSFKVLKLFHLVGPKVTTPGCLVEQKANFNPAIAFPSYFESDSQCTSPAKYYIPFFMKKPGPKSDEWTISAHEMMPGHHLQVQGFIEHFLSEMKGIVHWLSATTFFLAFDEGWALYSEDPLIARDSDAYKDLPLMKFAALKYQVVRAARLVVDIGLHSKRMTRDQAIKLLSKYMWDNRDKLESEVTRYQSVPGQAVSYMVGRTEIVKMRKEAERRLGQKFNIKDFHFHVIRNSASPFTYLTTAIQKYVDCVLDSTVEGCTEVLSPPIKHGSGSPSSHYHRPTFMKVAS